MECHVRPATSRDAAAISRVVLAALHESNSQDYPSDVIAKVEQSFSPEVITTQLAKRRVFVALLGEKIIGTAGLDGDVVRSVFVDPAHQKGGIGRHLMDVIHGPLPAQELVLCVCHRRLQLKGFIPRWVIRKSATSFMGRSAPSLWKSGYRISPDYLCASPRSGAATATLALLAG